MVCPTETTIPRLTQASITYKRETRDPSKNYLHGPLKFWGESDQGDILKTISVNIVQASNSIRWTGYVLFWVSSLLLRGNKGAFNVDAQHGSTMYTSGSTGNVGKD